MTMYPKGTRIEGVALRISDQTNVKVQGKWYTEVISSLMLPELLPSNVPLTLGHGPYVGDTTNGDGHQVGMVDLYRSADTVRFYGTLSEDVDLAEEQAVSAGWQSLRDDALIIECRSRDMDYRIPRQVEFGHIALVREGAYGTARIFHIGEEAAKLERSAAYMREWDDIEMRARLGQIEISYHSGGRILSVH